MSKSLMDKIRERKEEEERIANLRAKGYIKNSSLQMKWNDGQNPVRLVGNYYEVHTHVISPSSYGSIGVADSSNFKGKNALPFEVSCVNWNLKEERYHNEHTCPFCKLSERARIALKREDLLPEEKKLFEQIRAACKPSKKLKWNLIDRKAPFYYKVCNGNEEQVPGYKYANMSFGMFNDIKGIIEQTGMDITDIETGIDLNVSKSISNNIVKYSVQPVLFKGAVKVTPLTDEEKSWQLWDFIEMYDKPYNFKAIEEKMHTDFRAILSQSDEDFLKAVSVEEDYNPLIDEQTNDVEDEKKN